jgi:hypothetical protein
MTFKNFFLTVNRTGMLINPLPDQEGNKLQRQKILMFIYPIGCHNWRNISTIYICHKTSNKQNILTVEKIHRKVGRAKDLSSPRYVSILLARNNNDFRIFICHTLSQGPNLNNGIFRTQNIFYPAHFHDW